MAKNARQRTDLGVVIVNRNTVDHLEHCISAFLADGVARSRIVVVDQGSTDESVRMVHRRFRGVRVVANPENRGYSHAVNTGAGYLNTDILIIVNADVRFDPGTVGQVRETLEQDKLTAVVGPALISSNGSSVTRFSRTSVLRGILLLLTPSSLLGANMRYEQRRHSDATSVKVAFVEGCFMMFKRSAFDECGGFDDRFRFFSEDADIVLRMRKLGYNAIHDPRAIVTHIGGASFSKEPERLLPEFYTGLLTFNRIHYPRANIWLKRVLPWMASYRSILESIAGSFSGSTKPNLFRPLLRSIIRETRDIDRGDQSAEPLVSVVIPTKDRTEQLTSLLLSLKQQSYKKFEIIIVDQSEKIDSALSRVVNAMGRRCRVVRVERANRSYAKNVGIRESRGDIVLFLDDDIRVEPNLIATHLAAYKDPRVGGVSCRVKEEGFNTTDQARILKITWYGRMMAGYQSDVERFADTLIGGNMSIARSVLRRVGSFDPIFIGTSLFEEQDLSHRIRAEGFKILIATGSTVQHFPQRGGNKETRLAQPAEYYHWFHHNEMIYFVKNRTRFLLGAVVPFCFLRTIRQTVTLNLSMRDAIHIFRGVQTGLAAFRKIYR